MADRRRVFIRESLGNGSERDVFDELVPPFGLAADMLFVVALAPTEHLLRSFPEVPFLGLGGVTPLISWFSRVTDLAHGPSEARKSIGPDDGFGYRELNVLATLRGRRLFVPGIYATSRLSLALGHRYGMPKGEIAMTFHADSRRVSSRAESGGRISWAEATLLASGRILAKPFDWPAPWWTWPVAFPNGSYIRARIEGVPRAQLAHVSGRITLPVPWLPESVRLFPLGLFVPGLRMRLPGPGGRIT